MSVPNKIRKWVVEKFYGISPGLIAGDFILLSYERPCVSCNFFGGISISNASCSSGIIRALQNWRVIVHQEFGAHFKGPLAALEKKKWPIFCLYWSWHQKLVPKLDQIFRDIPTHW